MRPHGNECCENIGPSSSSVWSFRLDSAPALRSLPRPIHGVAPPFGPSRRSKVGIGMSGPMFAHQSDDTRLSAAATKLQVMLTLARCCATSPSKMEPLAAFSPYPPLPQSRQSLPLVPAIMATSMRPQARPLDDQAVKLA
jgi:hypothetical protein